LEKGKTSEVVTNLTIVWKSRKEQSRIYCKTFNTAISQSIDTKMELEGLTMFGRDFTYRRVISTASITKKPKIAI